MADYLQKLKKDTKEFTHAINYCLNNLKQKNFYLTNNIENENISERSKKVGDKMYDYMLGILEKMFNNDENELMNNDDSTKTSKCYFKIKQEIIKNINNDFKFHQEDENVCRENNNSLIVIKHVSADKTKSGKLGDTTSTTSSLSYNNSLNQSINSERSFYNNVNSEEEKKKEEEEDEEEEESVNDDEDDDYYDNRINNNNGQSVKKRKKYQILSYSEKVKLVNLSIDNPTWSLNKLQEVSGCTRVLRRSNFIDLKRSILHDRNTFEKFKTINDWIYQSCVIENPDINKITDAKLKSYTKRVKKIFGSEANEFSITKGWLYYMKKSLGISDESNNVKQEPKKSVSKNVGIYLFNHASSFEGDKVHDDDDSDWTSDENNEVLDDEEYHYITSEDDDDDDAKLSAENCVDQKNQYQNDNVNCKNIKRKITNPSTYKYHGSNEKKDNETILKEIIEPSTKKLKKYVPDEEKKRIVNMARKNPQWNFEQLKKESKCQELLFVSQLYDWQSQLEQNHPGSSKNIF